MSQRCAGFAFGDVGEFGGDGDGGECAEGYSGKWTGIMMNNTLLRQKLDTNTQGEKRTHSRGRKLRRQP
jgi:hypothetical protein